VSPACRWRGRRSRRRCATERRVERPAARAILIAFVSEGREEAIMRKFIIERDLPAIGSAEREQLKAAAAKSNSVLRQLGPDIQWVESYVASDKTFCVYMAKDENIIREHAKISGFPANKITEVRKMIDPTTANG
jgi:hypothetical protein